MEAYPLHWPPGQPRRSHMAQARFEVSQARAMSDLLEEIARLGGRYPVISSNVEVRRDGLPYSNRRAPADPAVAVYFYRNGKQMVFACDRWNKVSDNIRAIGKTIEALRGIERWGASEMMERAFSAFEALPGPDREPKWFDVLGVDRTASRQEINTAYRRLAKKAHPDAGGSDGEMIRLHAARRSGLSVADGLGGASK